MTVPDIIHLMSIIVVSKPLLAECTPSVKGPAFDSMLLVLQSRFAVAAQVGR